MPSWQPQEQHSTEQEQEQQEQEQHGTEQEQHGTEQLEQDEQEQEQKHKQLDSFLASRPAGQIERQRRSTFRLSTIPIDNKRKADRRGW